MRVILGQSSISRYFYLKGRGSPGNLALEPCLFFEVAPTCYRIFSVYKGIVVTLMGSEPRQGSGCGFASLGSSELVVVVALPEGRRKVRRPWVTLLSNLVCSSQQQRLAIGSSLSTRVSLSR